MDPYKILGISRDASDEEGKKAYHELARKYHPDNYVNNPLSDLVEEKMKQINEAYEMIQKGRAGRGAQNAGASANPGAGNTNAYDGDPILFRVRELMRSSRFAEAELVLDSMPPEHRGASAWLIYAVTGVLALILLPNKFIAVFYVLFAGFYPIMKEKFERLHYVISWILKLSLFNTSLLFVVLVSKTLLHLPEDELGFTIPVFALGNGAFLLYDIAMSKIITVYLVRLRSRLHLKNYFEN